MYMEYWPLPSLRYFADVGGVYSNICTPAAAAAGIARSSQLSSYLAEQAVQCIIAAALQIKDW
jgi:hypothetical protein